MEQKRTLLHPASFHQFELPYTLSTTTYTCLVGATGRRIITEDYHVWGDDRSVMEEEIGRIMGRNGADEFFVPHTSQAAEVLDHLQLHQ